MTIAINTLCETIFEAAGLPVVPPGNSDSSDSEDSGTLDSDNLVLEEFEPPEVTPVNSVPKEKEFKLFLDGKDKDIPAAFLNYFKNKDSCIKLSVCSDKKAFKATTQNLLDRLSTIEKAFKKLKQISKIDFQELSDYIKTNFNIDTLRDEKGDKFSIKDLKKLLEEFNRYLERTVLVQLAQSYKSPLKVKYGNKEYKDFLRILRAKEIETISKEPRPTYVNFDSTTNYFTAEIPLGLNGDTPYTDQSYSRNKPRLANYVLHVIGYRDPNYPHTITILNQSTRAANYVPIDYLRDDSKTRCDLLRDTLAQVRQRHDSVCSLNPAATTFTQISLLSPLAAEGAELDKQHGLLQTEFSYIAFLLQNLDRNPNSSMDMRYCVEGVNAGRSNTLSDPLKFHINTRFYNQLIIDAITQLGLECPVLLEKISTYKQILSDSWQSTVLCKLTDIKTAYHSKNEKALNAAIINFKKALAEHHQLELELFAYLQGAWKTNSETLQSSDPEKNNIIQEINNFYFLQEKDRYQKPEYNFQLQSCVHRLSASLSHEVGVNCNDGEDRTGLHCVLLAASLQKQNRNSNAAPDISDSETLKGIQTRTGEIQSIDAGMNNAAANCPGAPAQEVDPKYVAAGMVNAEGVEIAKLAKKPYHSILKLNYSWVDALDAAILFVCSKVRSFCSNFFSSSFKKITAAAAAGAMVAAIGFANPSVDSNVNSMQSSPVSQSSSTARTDNLLNTYNAKKSKDDSGLNELMSTIADRRDSRNRTIESLDLATDPKPTDESSDDENPFTFFPKSLSNQSPAKLIINVREHSSTPLSHTHRENLPGNSNEARLKNPPEAPSLRDNNMLHV